MFYDMSTMRIEVLILCSANEGSIRIPSSLCKYYMINHRITDSDIQQLREGAGLEYILNGTNPDKYEVAEIFIARGLDVNGVNHYIARLEDKGMTPLQGAVVGNDVPSVKFLLKQEASLDITGYRGMTALELARKRHKANDEFLDNSEIIKILSDASNTKSAH